MNYESNWDFYFSNVDNKLASFYLDLGLINVAPIETKKQFLNISVKMNNPRPDGLSSDKEFEALLELENHLVNALTENHEVIYAGRLTSDGNRSFYFYLSNSLLIDKTISESLVSYPNYDYNYDVREDKDWNLYIDFIYPNPKQVQVIMNRKVLAQLENNGDKLTKPREVNHWIYFVSNEDRERYLNEVKKENFKIESIHTMESDTTYKYGLRISRIDHVNQNAVDKYVIYLSELANELSGNYDGWETSIETDDE